MFVALRDLRFARGRFALMGSVVALITLLVTLLSGLTAGLAEQNVSAVTGLPATHLAFAAPPDGEKLSFADSRVRPEDWRRWAEVPGVEWAHPLGISPTRLAVADRTAGATALGVPRGSPLAPAGLAPGQVVVSAPLAAEEGITVGDEVTLGAGSIFRVAAVGGDAYYSHTPGIWLTLDDWNRLDPRAAGGATVVALDAPGADIAAADARIGTHTVALDDSLTAIGSYAAENASLQAMRGFLFVISALVIGAFFTVWTIQRKPEIAVLKALGASTGYVLRDALAQAVVVLVAGAGLGGLVGAALGALAGRAVPFVLDPATTVLPVLVMILLGAGGAALAVRRVTAVDPLIALGAAR
ncbi:ABC transporter substrate-binding protein [Longimycelium tulufanense]|uniref:ABC transporter substrate-binding protein n=1 Tax=Longimycelium tulufanense TaxID=907463 RepID=A0A8J3CF85_9PSEU|nr:ABC transporter permease [Longimycelium tulufanense]GGM56915.1 ABC transporter substrate-binding protein [Longimycelium tulufanense]